MITAVGADDGQAAQGGHLEGQHPVVGQQNHRLGGGPADQYPVVGNVGFPFGHVQRVVEGAGALQEQQESSDRPVEQ